MAFHNQEDGLAFRPSAMSHSHDSATMQTGIFPQLQVSDAKVCPLRQCFRYDWL